MVDQEGVIDFSELTYSNPENSISPAELKVWNNAQNPKVLKLKTRRYGNFLGGVPHLATGIQFQFQKTLKKIQKSVGFFSSSHHQWLS